MGLLDIDGIIGRMHAHYNQQRPDPVEPATTDSQVSKILKDLEDSEFIQELNDTQDLIKNKKSYFEIQKAILDQIEGSDYYN